MATPIRKDLLKEFPKRVHILDNATQRIQPLFNRELSLLEFHARVLEEANDPTNPLLERLKFISIFASNIDEFFMIRVSGLKEELEQGITFLSPDGLTPAQQLDQIRERILGLIREQEECLQEILAQLKAQGVELTSYDSLSEDEQEGLERYFCEKVFPVLTPLIVDPSHPFPYISPLSLNLGVMVEGDDEYFPGDGRRSAESTFVRIKVPSAFPRLVPVNAGSTKFIPVEDLIEAHVESLFPGMNVGKCYLFRVTRDADIEIREQEAHDLLDVIEEELRRRRFGMPVRLEVSADMPQEMIDFLSSPLGLVADDVYPIGGLLSVQEIAKLTDLDRPDLKDKPFQPRMPEWFTEHDNIFDAIRERDRLLHHPYDSYDCVTGFINQAVDDPDVVAIKICLYRTGPDSPIPPSLIRASENGKQVTALIELKARFDEEHNIEWARRLDEAGVHVVYGILGLKTHGKLTMVVRREGEELKRYVHIASGNYNPTTSCTYTDVGLFTVDPEIGRDATELFNYLTGFSRQSDYRKLTVAPINLREKLNELFDREIAHKRAGRPARIVGKFNRLADQQIISKLYEVSKAGVEIDLIVRGICMLRPGIAGLSENIRIRSIVGRFLEHSRVFYFANGGDEEFYIGSADWMSRNLKNRIEVLSPVTDVDSTNFLKNVLLDSYFRDNTKARELQPNGSYTEIPSNDEPFNAQEFFMRR